MFGDAPRSPFTGVPGWETQNEQEALLHYASQVPGSGLILEIGGEYGMSASLFAKAAPQTVDIVTIDLFPGDLQSQHMANLAEAGFLGRTHAIKANSREAAESWPTATPSGTEIDLLFIDGDHTYDGVVADIVGWIPYVKPGGFVIFHDATPSTNLTPHPLHYEVNRAIDQWIAQTGFDGTTWQEQSPVGTMRIFQLVGQRPILDEPPVDKAYEPPTDKTDDDYEPPKPKRKAKP